MPAGEILVDIRTVAGLVESVTCGPGDVIRDVQLKIAQHASHPGLSNALLFSQARRPSPLPSTCSASGLVRA